jgi:hypothetical protein
MAVAGQQANTGLYIPTTAIFDIISRLQQSNANSEEFKELIVRLSQQVNSINIALNLKESGLYPLEEFLNSKLWFNASSDNPDNQRQSFHYTFNTGALGAGANTIAHGLTIAATWQMMSIRGAASDTSGINYAPIPNSGAAYISVSVDATNITIDNNSGIAFTDSVVVLEYCKFI